MIHNGSTDPDKLCREDNDLISVTRLGWQMTAKTRGQVIKEDGGWSASVSVTDLSMRCHVRLWRNRYLNLKLGLKVQHNSVLCRAMTWTLVGPSQLRIFCASVVTKVSVRNNYLTSDRAGPGKANRNWDDRKRLLQTTNCNSSPILQTFSNFGVFPLKKNTFQPSTVNCTSSLLNKQLLFTLQGRCFELQNWNFSFRNRTNK